MPVYTADSYAPCEHGEQLSCDECGGCWHYDFEEYCTQCDAASYGPCEPNCTLNHTCCTCESAGGCEIHEEDCEDCGDPLDVCECDDGERLACEGCGESFNATETGCGDHCLHCAGPDAHCARCQLLEA